MNDKDQLIAMGFDPARVEWALRATQNRGLQPAMDHLFENEGKPVPAAGSEPASTAASGTASNAMDVDDEDEDAEALRAALKLSKGGSAAAAGAQDGSSGDVGEAKSIKCAQCGKTFKNTALANFHAEKSGHDQFEESTEEIKPLTEEEKKQKLAELREKMAEKRAVKSKADAEEAKANEAIRRKSGKDQTSAKTELQVKEAMKDAAQKKKDKLDDAKARAAIKAQIEADKRERAERTAREKLIRSGNVAATPAAQTAPGAAPAAASSTSGKDYKETRLQIRLASGGQPYTTTLPSEATLQEVAEFLAGQTMEVDVETVSFAMHFPRKQFSRADFSKTLKSLGLTPSAVLIAS